MLSNVSEPLIGVVNTAVIGQLPNPYYIGAIAAGALIFSFIFWGFGFLRLSTGGLSAQAVGAGDAAEVAAVLIRALVIAVAAGLFLIALSPLISRLAFDLIGGSAGIRNHGEVYFGLRIWSRRSPSSLLRHWLVHRPARAKLAFLVPALPQCRQYGAPSALFVLGLGMTPMAWGLPPSLPMIAAAALGVVIALILLSDMAVNLDRTLIFHPHQLWRTVAMNGDVMIRTLCLVFAFAWFTARGARAGDVTIAANAVLMHFFSVAAYLIDGFAYASETLVGQSVGARNRERFRAAVRITSIWAVVVGAASSLIIWFAGPWLIDLMTVSPRCAPRRGSISSGRR